MDARRVLIVDDDPDIVVYLTSFLEDNGYETRAAADGADALAAVAEFRPDAVLTDVLLPGRSGLDLLVTLRHPRVVALSIDGNEAAAGRTGPRFAEAFRRAGAAGLKRTVHAGESSGPEGVRDAIELLGADRIDHGVRAIEDPSVVALLVDKRIALGVCPTSNLKLGVVPAIEQHPIERLRHAGVAVSVNTDDPALLDTSLEQEYALCRDTFEWSDDDVWSVARTSIDASFANDDVKTRLREALSRW